MPSFARPSAVEPAEHVNPAHLTAPLQLRRLSADPFLLHITFPPHGRAERHSHRFDTVYVLQRGSMIVGDEVVEAGDVFWVHAGETYGPESAGADGAEVLVHSIGGPLGTDWE